MKRLFFILLSFILIVTAIAVPSLAANLFPTTPLDVTLFDYVVYDCDNAWTTVAVGHGNSFTYTFQANKNYAVRFASPYLPSSLISAGNTVDYYIIDLSCSTSSYSSPKMNAAVFYYNSSGGRIGITDKTYDYVNFDSLPVCNMNFNHGLNSSTFRFVTDFNYFKVSSTKSVTFTLNAFAYGESNGEPVVDAHDFLTDKLNDGSIVTDGFTFPRNYFISDQRAYPTNSFISSGFYYTSFDISGSNLSNPPPNNSNTVGGAYNEYGYNFVFHPLGNNFIRFNEVIKGVRLNYNFDISVSSNVDQWADLFESPRFSIDFYDADYKFLENQSVLIENISLSNGHFSGSGSLKVDAPVSSYYIKVSIISNGWCPLSWNQSGYVKFQLNTFEFYFSKLIGSTIFDDNLGLEDFISGELGDGSSILGGIQDNFLGVVQQFSVAFSVLSLIFTQFSSIPIFSYLLWLSISVGSFALLLSLSNSILGKKESSSGTSSRSDQKSLPPGKGG